MALFLYETVMLKSFCWFSAGFNSSFYDAFQKQFSRRALIKSCSDNIQQMYRRTPLLRWDFNKITLRHGCSPLNLLHIFRTAFVKDSSGGGAASDFLFRERFDKDWTRYTVKFCNINRKSFPVESVIFTWKGRRGKPGTKWRRKIFQIKYEKMKTFHSTSTWSFNACYNRNANTTI